jgi:hypothetical protein
MKNRLLTIIGVSTAFAVSGQSPEIEAWMLNTDGDMADYEFYPGPPPTTSAVQLTDSSDVKTVCYNATDVYVRANGLASYTMGPWLQNPNVPSSQEWVFKIPRSPIEATGMNTSTPFGGAQAVAINGVLMYGYGDGKSYSSSTGSNEHNGDGNWVGDAWVSEGSTLDATGAGHADGNERYHYHATPFSLYTDPSTGHSVIIGYALDGFPIYGPYGYTIATNSSSGTTRMVSSYALRSITDRTILPNGSNSTPPGPAITTGGSFDLGTYIQDYEYVVSSGSLDEYNGRYCVTPEYPSGTYAYFLSTDNSGDPQFPYILAGSYYGVLSQQDLQSAGNSTSPGGLTCYTETPNSIEEELTEGVSIYPNPANSFVKIISESIPQEIIILSLDGKVIESLNPSSLKTELSISNYPSGIYLVRVLNNNAGTFKRLVITE